MMKKILIVDDEYDIASNLCMIFSMEGYDATSAYHGRAALELIKDGLMPDLIISDVMMPMMDGYELIQKLKADEKLKHIPIILMSAAHLDETRVNKSDIHFFVGKPFNLDKFILAVSNVFAGTP